jgi:hypothetical protein
MAGSHEIEGLCLTLNCSYHTMHKILVPTSSYIIRRCRTFHLNHPQSVDYAIKTKTQRVQSASVTLHKTQYNDFYL